MVSIMNCCTLWAAFVCVLACTEARRFSQVMCPNSYPVTSGCGGRYCTCAGAARYCPGTSFCYASTRYCCPVQRVGMACYYQQMCPSATSCSYSRCSCPSGYTFQGTSCVRIVQPVVVVRPQPVVLPATRTCSTCYPQPQTTLVIVAPGQPCQLRAQLCGGGSSCMYTLNLGVCTCPQGRTAIGGVCQAGAGIQVVRRTCTSGCIVGAGDYCAFGGSCVNNAQCLNQLCRCNYGWVRRGKACLSYKK